MVNVDKAVIAKLKRNGKNFEILVDPENALKLRSGEEVPIEDVLADFKIFSDAKKGLHATESNFEEIFNTKDEDKIAIEIIKKGEIQITSDHKRKSLDEKKNRIIGIITSNAIDAQTKLPIPRQRIELCFEQLKIKINEHETDEYEVNRILKELKILIPIKFEEVEIEARIGHLYSGKAIGIIKREYPTATEIWDDQSNLLIKVRVPAGKADELRSKLSEITHGTGTYEIKEIQN